MRHPAYSAIRGEEVAVSVKVAVALISLNAILTAVNVAVFIARVY